MLLHNPRNARHAHQERMDALEWEDDDEGFAAWCEGRTGFPVVDAGMRQLRARGWMHNRARLITACFLTKDLHIDWRRGEAHFMRWLLCGDEAQNNGNWQWISSVGVDPAPYFRRLYNPVTQQRRHDPDRRLRAPLGARAARRARRAPRRAVEDGDAPGGLPRADRRPRARARAGDRALPRRPARLTLWCAAAWSRRASTSSRTSPRAFLRSR